MIASEASARIAASGLTLDGERREESELKAVLKRVAGRFFFLLVPAGLLFIALWPIGEAYAFDFRVFWEAGRAFADGVSPYPEQSAAVIATKENFVYPSAMAALFAPLSFAPFAAAAFVYSLVVAAAPIVTLRLLGVRDWRCYGAVFLGLPVAFSVSLGTISTLLALGLAVLWRYRDRVAVAAPVLALLVLSKLFLWPLFVWFIVARRFKTAALAAAIAVVATLATWWRIGLDTMAEYPHLLRLVADVEQADSFSPTALALGLGADADQARAGAFVLGLAIVLFGLSRRRPRLTEFQLLVLALAAALVWSPIIWGHYLVLLFVPIAIARPRLSPLWLATIWMTPDNLQYGFNYGFEAGGVIATAAGLAVIATLLWRTARLEGVPTAASIPPARAAFPPAHA